MQRIIGAKSVDLLSRYLILVAGDVGPGDEWAGIVWAVRNRTNGNGRSISSVLLIPSWSDDRCLSKCFRSALHAPKGIGYRDKQGYRCPADSIRFDQALDCVYEVYEGHIANPVENRTFFVHPGSYSRCLNGWRADRKCKCVNGRWLPRRFVPTHAPNPPIRVGRALFV